MGRVCDSVEYVVRLGKDKRFQRFKRNLQVRRGVIGIRMLKYILNE